MSVKQIDLVKIYATKRCLIIDDMSEVRGALMRMLRTFGATKIDTAATGDEAMELCRAHNYGIVLCDYNLGQGKDGQQVLEELRHFKLLKNTSLFVMITAEQSRRMVLAALEYQPDEYIAKPITPSILRTRLDRALLRHQSFIDIKQCLDDEDLNRALGLCDQRLADGEPYQQRATQMQAELCFRLKDLDRAETIYDQVLSERSTVWAHLGLGRVHMARGEHDKAQEQFNIVLGVDERYVEAHDLLANSFDDDGDTVSAQAAMQRGVEVSPKSVLRQRELARLARRNNDRETVIKACRDTLRLGLNSCYESPQDYLTLARELGREADGDTSAEGRAYAKEANSVLQKAEKRYSSDEVVAMQATAMRSRISSGQSKLEEARAQLERAKSLREVLKAREVELPPESELDVADALISAGGEDKIEGEQLLAQVAKANAGNSAIADWVDALSDEPLSKQGRQRAARLTKRGIASYEAGDFEQSIEVFQQAVKVFPKHTGLNLNLVQAALAKFKEKGVDPAMGPACQQAMRAVGELDEIHPQYQRYQFLKKQVDELFPPS